MKKMVFAALTSVSVLALAACNSGNETGGDGEISGTITMLLNRTDIVNTVFQEYAEEFNELYPDVTVEFEAISDYEGQTKIRMNTQDYGDVLLLPQVHKHELADFFEPLGEEEELEEDYLFVDDAAYEGTTYGIPIMVNTFGAVYNRSVFEEAGITDIPNSPEAFLEAMEAIKSSTEAIPYYTNFSAGWPLSDWENNRLAVAGEGDYVSQQMPYIDDPFSPGRPHYELYQLMYDLADQQLIEPDPLSTDWELSKQMLADGEIGAMFLGVWAVSQIQGLAENPDDIAYMPFPYSQDDGSQFAVMAPDYKIGINKHSDNKAAARAWLDWFVDESGYALSEGAISPIVGDDLPTVLSDFEELEVEFIQNEEAREGEEALTGEIDQRSEVGLGLDEFKQRIIEAGIGNRNESFDDIMNDLNTRWANAREELEID